jgi:hypothetical protein
MYFSVFQSSEYNSDEDTNNINNTINEKTNNDDSDNCIICWSPECPLLLLSDIPNITLQCECNPMIHQKCLNSWLITTSSCPICRKVITVKNRLKWSLNMRLIIGRFIQFMFKVYFCILAFNLLIIIADQIIKM